MNPLFAAATEVQDLCRRHGWGFCFIGGLAPLLELKGGVSDLDRFSQLLS